MRHTSLGQVPEQTELDYIQGSTPNPGCQPKQKLFGLGRRKALKTTAKRFSPIALKQIALATWGPILDHGLGFMLDTWQYYWDTGDLSAVRPAYQSLRRYAQYLDA